MGNKNALRPDKGERRRTERTFAVPPCFCRRLAATASEGANTPRSGNGNTRRPLLTLLTFHGHGSRGSFRGPTRRFAPATGSLTSGIARTFLVRCPIFLRLLPPVYTMEPGDASSHKRGRRQHLAGSRCGCRCWCTARPGPALQSLLA